MVERILSALETCTFDFRSCANPADPMRHLFDEWVDYYRLKWAIAAAIQPRRILEVGVRYGYSAAAFLAGAPGAHYTGIDLDVPAFGGGGDGLPFARRHLPPDAILLQEDTQRLQVYPGGHYDLIHIDGQQDEAGTYHDLELAVRQADYILVDGYFWTRSNFLTASDFLLKHRDLLRYAVAIPGYAGELLLAVRPRTAAGTGSGRTGSAQLRALYDRHYFQRECGGWEFQKGAGQDLLEDARLRAVFNLAMAWSPATLLDIGCGRGEICRQAARCGVSAVGLDYSEAAIEIAREASAREPALATRTEWFCGDANALPETTQYDVIVLSDVVEHLSPDEMERLLAKISRLLAPGGKLVLHTFPNLWFYRYDYARRRRQAAALGAYLPAEPRSRYEREMHINECNPRDLRRALRRHFPHVAFWFGSPEEPVASLTRRLSPAQLAAQRDLFAVASFQPVDLTAVLETYQTVPLSTDDARGLHLSSALQPFSIVIGQTIVLEVEIENRSKRAISSEAPWPLFLCYHWLHQADRQMALFEGHRSRLTAGQPAGTRRRHTMVVALPSMPGDYVLQLTILQEHVMWVNDVHASAQFEVAVRVDSAEA